jgi:hypothetical protein
MIVSFDCFNPSFWRIAKNDVFSEFKVLKAVLFRMLCKPIFIRQNKCKKAVFLCEKAKNILKNLTPQASVFAKEKTTFAAQFSAIFCAILNIFLQ